MHDFDFLEPRSIAEASEMMLAHAETASVMAGGTALMLALRQRMVAPKQVISLLGIRELRGITWSESQGLRIGALTRHAEVARSALVRQHAPMLADVAARLANPQVRNQGTLGGNLCYGDPATDPPSCLLALDAEVVLQSARGTRILKIDEFSVDYFVTAMEPGELLSEIRIPPNTFNAGYHARFMRTAAEHRPLVNFAISLRKRDDICDDARLVAGASTRVPTRLREAEKLMRGQAMTSRLAAEVAELGASEIEPISDLRGDGEFRRDMLRVVGPPTTESLFNLDGSSATGAA